MIKMEVDLLVDCFKVLHLQVCKHWRLGFNKERDVLEVGVKEVEPEKDQVHVFWVVLLCNVTSEEVCIVILS